MTFFLHLEELNSTILCSISFRNERTGEATSIKEKMTLNTSGFLNDSALCNDNLTSFNQMMDRMYTYFYLLLFIPGLILNTIALWVLCRHIRCPTAQTLNVLASTLQD